MKKPTRIAYLGAALVLSGFATAGAWPYDENCYYSCGHVETVPYGACCGTFHSPDHGGGSMWSDSRVCESP